MEPSLSLAEGQKRFSLAKTKDYEGHKKNVRTVAWNCNGKKFASGSSDVRVWALEPHSHSKDLELRGHTDQVEQLAWDPLNVDRLATASVDRTVRLWDTRSGKSQSIATSGENINLAWSPTADQIAVGSKEDIISIIDVRKGKVVRTARFHWEVNEISWSRDGKLFFLTTGIGSIEVLAFNPKMEKIRTLACHTGNIYCLGVDPTGKYIAAGGADAVVSLWDMDEMVCVRTFTQLEWPVRTLSFSHDGQFIASASEDMAIDISHVESGAPTHTIACRATVDTVAWNPMQYLLAYAEDARGREEGLIHVFGFS